MIRLSLPVLAFVIALRLPAQVTTGFEPEMTASGPALPDSPGFVVLDGLQQLPAVSCVQPLSPDPKAPPAGRPTQQPCPSTQNPNRPFVDANRPVIALTPAGKARLAFRDVSNLFNLLTVAANSAFYIGLNSHTGYGPGLKGFGYNVGTTLSQDATGEFIGTFAVCSLFHQDPRYFRMPKARPLRRLGHAIAHVAVAHSDSGKLMINYENFVTAPIAAELSNLYVPGINTNAPSTVERILAGFELEPIGTIIAEFLPDVASHIHVRIVIVQRFLNQISAQPAGQPGVL